MAYKVIDKTTIINTASNEEELEIKHLIGIAWLNIQHELFKGNTRCESIITQKLDGDPAPLKEGKTATQDHITTITLRCEPINEYIAKLDAERKKYYESIEIAKQDKAITCIIETRYLGIAHGSASQGQTPDCEYINTYKGSWKIQTANELTIDKITSILYGQFDCNYEYIDYEEWLKEWHKQ